MTFKFSEGWKRFIVEFSAADIGVKALIGSGIKVVIVAPTNGSFDEISIGVGYSSMVAVACQNADAIQVGGCDFLVLLLERVESFSCAFHMVGCEWGTVSSKREDCGTEVGRTVDNMLLALFRDIGEEKIVEGSANDGVRVRDLLGPKVKHLSCPRRNGADDTEVIHESVEVSTPGNKIGWVVQFLEVGILGIFEESLGKVFNKWVREVCSCRRCKSIRRCLLDCFWFFIRIRIVVEECFDSWRVVERWMPWSIA